MLRFEIALAPEAVAEFDAVFRLFARTVADSGEPGIHQIAFQVLGGERRIVMFERESHRCAFAAVWEAVVADDDEAEGQDRPTSKPKGGFASERRPQLTSLSPVAAAS